MFVFQDDKNDAVKLATEKGHDKIIELLKNHVPEGKYGKLLTICNYYFSVYMYMQY